MWPPALPVGIRHTAEFDPPMRPGPFGEAEDADRISHKRELHTVNVGTLPLAFRV